MSSFQNRVIGAIGLRASVYEEVEHDASATTQAAVVVAAAHLSQAIAGIRFSSTSSLLISVVVGLLGWIVGSAVLLAVGTKLFPGRNTEADMGQMLRTLGFAQAAGLLGVFGVVPWLGWLVFLLVSVWILVAMVVAVRQALDYEDTSKALMVCAVAWVLMLVIQLAATFLGVGAAVVGSRVM